MLEYFFNVKNRDVAHRQKFVVISTALSFLIILGVWIPFRVMQFKSIGNTKETVAENKNETTSPSPVVAGDTTTRSDEEKPNLPFLSGAKPNPTMSPTSEAELKPTASPDSGMDAPLINESSSEPMASATPVASDFPTL